MSKNDSEASQVTGEDTDPTQDPTKMLKRLRIGRGAHRAQMTKLLGKAHGLVNDDGVVSDKHTLKGVLESMNYKLDVIKDLDYQILDHTADDALEQAIIEADDYVEVTQSKIRSLYVTLGLTNVESDSNRNDGTLNASYTQSTPRKVNLPKLQLPKFDGNILKWTPFYDAFCAAVHNDNHLDNIQKFQYLCSTLSGEAAHAIEGLPLTNSNYDEALSVLKKRYGQPHKIIASFMKALWELPKPNDNLDNLEEFYNNLETYIRGLRSLGKTEDTYGDLLIPIIFEKLPAQLKTQISRDHGDKAWTLKELREAIYKEIQATEAGNHRLCITDLINCCIPCRFQV